MSQHYYSRPGTDSASPRYNFNRPTLKLLSWPLTMPHRLRRKIRSTKAVIRSRQSPASSSIARLATSFNPSHTIDSLHAHRWSRYDAQYLVLLILAIFSLSIIPTYGPFFKTLVASLLLTALVLPVTRQFFLPILPIFAWLTFFYACQFIPAEYRPPIWVRVLPALENILYGANLSDILSAHKRTVLDVLAWLPYGITHFGAPFVASILIFIFAPPKTLPVFARAFGYMNIAGVVIQVLFPCSPPWYENLHGLAPADYSMPGSPAGLAAIDKLFGIDLYTSTFTASPMVFGAFPSLHSGSATIEALFLSHVFPRLRPLFIAYTLWLWWATMYLSHHYAVDLAAGALLSGLVFLIADLKFLPRLQPGKLFRWDYDFIEIGRGKQVYAYAYGPTAVDADSEMLLDQLGIDLDDWTAASSSSVESASRSPSTNGGRSAADDNGSMWDGDTLAGHSDSEPVDKAAAQVKDRVGQDHATA